MDGILQHTQWSRDSVPQGVPGVLLGLQSLSLYISGGLVVAEFVHSFAVSDQVLLLSTT